MSYRSPGQFKDLEAFRARLQEIDPQMDLDPVLEGAAGPLGRPIEVAGKTLTNRFAVHPMEGWDGTREGLPTENTLRRWRRFGRNQRC